MSSVSIKKLAIKGAIWAIATYGTSQILRFGSNLILTRLLAPKLFGLMALVYVFISGLHLFSDVGLGPSIIQNKRGNDPAFLNTAWTLQVIRSVILWVGCLLIAWPVSRFYNEPQLVWLLPLVGLNTLISGFNSTALFTLNRELAVREIALYEMGGQVVSIGVMIVWAYFHPSIMALVVGSMVSVFIQMIWSHRLNSGHPNRFAWEPEAMKELISFGKWIFLSTAMTFLAAQTDRLVLGKLLSIELLGIYGIAFTLADMPRQVILAISDKVIFPAFSKFAGLPRSEFRAKIEKNRSLLLVGMAVILAVVVAFGDLAVSFLYDNRYEDAAWMLPVLALGIWPIVLTQTIDAALFAVGNPRFVALGCFFSFLALAIGIPGGYALWGSLGAVGAVSLSNIPPYMCITYGLWREKLACLWQDLWSTLLFIALLGGVLALRHALGLAFPVVSL
ncbi:MAG TPA: oligosaccharide flippase family protein [Halomicronema sp.]